MGLDDTYHQARSQILLMTPLPSENQAYAMILNDEGQKAITSFSVGLLGTGPTTSSQDEATPLYSKPGSFFQRVKKDYNVQCDFCKLKGHVKENCYKLVGYPSSFNKKREILMVEKEEHIKEHIMFKLSRILLSVRDKKVRL